jgi:hypothetical protein
VTQAQAAVDLYWPRVVRPAPNHPLVIRADKAHPATLKRIVLRVWSVLLGGILLALPDSPAYVSLPVGSRCSALLADGSGSEMRAGARRRQAKCQHG